MTARARFVADMCAFALGWWIGERLIGAHPLRTDARGKRAPRAHRGPRHADVQIRCGRCGSERVHHLERGRPTGAGNSGCPCTTDRVPLVLELGPGTDAPR